MQFDRAFCLAICYPVEHRQTQINDGSVERIYLVFETEAMSVVLCNDLALVQHEVKYVFINLSGSMSIGVGQS